MTKHSKHPNVISTSPEDSLASNAERSWSSRLVGILSRFTTRKPARYVWLGITGVVIATASLFHITNPYSQFSIVDQPYISTVADGEITIEKQFELRAYSGWFAHNIGYLKSGFLIVQNAWFGSSPAAGNSADEIVASIHSLRFDPSKPYLISGDQFSVLYVRNLGVFYNSLLDPGTAHSQKDWENRQRIYLQSALYALDAFSNADTLATTIVPVAPRSAVLTQVHPGSLPSDSLYGMLYALQALQDEAKYSNSTYRLMTADATTRLVAERRTDLQRLVEIYQSQVQDPSTGMVKRGIKLASARDGVSRDSSFYDNVVLWKSLSLANDLGVAAQPSGALDDLRQRIITMYWNESAGHFADDATNDGFSSDWLIALPTGFLTFDQSSDRRYLKRSVDYIRENRIDEPLPIAYTKKDQTADEPWAVRTFVSSYGRDAIWSYWGAQYITLLGQLYEHDPVLPASIQYKQEAERHILTYRQKIVETRGFPETFDNQGEFLQTPVYKSIRKTGWVVQFEQAEMYFPDAKREKPRVPQPGRSDSSSRSKCSLAIVCTVAL